jgi:hypothetical protein
MKVYLNPPAHLSRAMFRVATAMVETMPNRFELAPSEDAADLLVMHVIGLEAITHRLDKQVATIQYCMYPGAGNVAQWHPLWTRSLAIWSYYDLAPHLPEGARFYYAPMGVNGIFSRRFPYGPRPIGAMTSGYVNGPGAEAIEEVAIACDRLGIRSMHLGPPPTNMSENAPPLRWVHDISDVTLAGYYRQCRYVSGLRFVEGFELPALEGLACGARPIMFDRPDAHAWFGDHAEYVPEVHGEPLVKELMNVLSRNGHPVTEEERTEVLYQFDWHRIARGFWNKIMEAL